MSSPADQPPAGGAEHLLWAVVLLGLVPLLACVAPMALEGFPTHPHCDDTPLPDDVHDRVVRNGRLWCGLAAVVLLGAGPMWWRTRPPMPRPGALAWTLTVIAVGVVVAFGLLAAGLASLGATVGLLVVWVVALVAVLLPDGLAARLVVLLSAVVLLGGGFWATVDVNSVLCLG